jgi:uncharacterized protein YceH (UPF0502 family)
MALETELTEIQARVLACLVEKKATTPDQYPLTLNAIKNACNQKSSRFPVTSYYEGEIGHSLRELEELGLVSEAWSTRVAKYEQHFGKVLEVLQKDQAVLCTLMLRGPQTAAEIRNHSQRLYAFDDIDDVDYMLQRLAEHEPAMVMQLPRQAGQKEQRFVHLLCGEPDLSNLPAPPVSARTGLEERVSLLEAEVEALKQQLSALLPN